MREELRRELKPCANQRCGRNGHHLFCGILSAFFFKKSEIAAEFHDISNISDLLK